MNDGVTDRSAKLGRPNVILVTFDSLSAHDMSLYGYPRTTTPSLDRFATESYVFERMYANSNSTLPSLGSIITGRYPLKHGYDRWSSLLAGRTRVEDLADILAGHGYSTAAIVGTVGGSLWVNSLGDGRRGRLGKMAAAPFKGRTISRATASLDTTFRKTLDAMDAARRPFFLWLHLYPPHEPYLPSGSFKGAFVSGKGFDGLTSQWRYFNRFYPAEAQPAIDLLRGRYNEHILEIDHKFGGFLDAARQRGLFERSLIVVTSDHGEMFEKGYQGHNGPLLYDPLLHIPLMVRLPDGRPGGRVKARAEQVDIAPTILDLLGLAIPEQMHGESLVAAMQGEGASEKPKFSIAAASRMTGGDSPSRSMAVVFNGHKLIVNAPTGACELYDLALDPDETTDLAAGQPDMGRQLRGMIVETFANGDHCLGVLP